MLKPLTQLIVVALLAAIIQSAIATPTIQAQDGDTIQYGDVINGGFTEGGVHSWTFTGQAGDSVAINLVGNNIAISLTLQQPDGETIEGVVDESGFSATIETSLPEGGEYRIFASTVEENTSGEYSLSLTGTSADPSEGTILGELLTIDGTREGADIEYPFDGLAGDTIVITMTSPDFDTVVELRDPEGVIIAADDDGGIGYNSLIIITLPVDGSYNVVARSYFDGEGGEFAISVTSFAPAIIEDGTVWEVMSDGEPSIFTLVAEADQPVSLSVLSLDFDPIVSVRASDGNTVAFNDDFDNNMNSHLETTLAEAGTYFVVVESYDSYTAGAYTIGYNVEGEIVVAAPSSDTDTSTTAPSSTDGTTPIDFDVPINGQLDGEAQRYAFEGQADDAITIEMTSNNLDAFVQLLDEDGELVGEDDDSGQAFNARLQITLPTDGTYTIIASKRIGNPIGTYTLRLTREE